MEAPFCLVDAFTPKRFGGNQAAVVELVDWYGQDEWPPEFWMQAIAAEFNLSETAFLKASPSSEADYDLRWFTPTTEVNLCGHATLASAYALASDFFQSRPADDLQRIVFATKLGLMPVNFLGENTWQLDFPADHAEPAEPPEALRDFVGDAPVEWLKGRDDWMAVFAEENDVIRLRPKFSETRAVEGGIRGLIATAKADWGTGFDFVSRFFAPWSGINEDPVTGSAHCTLTPYWAKQLGKTQLKAKQVSLRGGILEVIDQGERTLIAGQCAIIARGKLGESR